MPHPAPSSLPPPPSGFPRETAAFLRISILSILFTLLVAAIISALAASIPAGQSAPSNAPQSLQGALWSPYLLAITFATIATAALFISAEQTRLARATWCGTANSCDTLAPPALPAETPPSGGPRSQTPTHDPSFRFIICFAQLQGSLRRPLAVPFRPRAATLHPARTSRFWKRIAPPPKPPITPPLPVLLRPHEIGLFLIPFTLIVALAHTLILFRLRAAALSPLSPSPTTPAAAASPNHSLFGIVSAMFKDHPTTQVTTVALIALIAVITWSYLLIVEHHRRQSRRAARFHAGRCLACDYPLRPPSSPIPSPTLTTPDATGTVTHPSDPCPECGALPPPLPPSHP